MPAPACPLCNGTGVLVDLDGGPDVACPFHHGGAALVQLDPAAADFFRGVARERSLALAAAAPAASAVAHQLEPAAASATFTPGPEASTWRGWLETVLVLTLAIAFGVVVYRYLGSLVP